jgi:hypothetical protein
MSLPGTAGRRFEKILLDQLKGVGSPKPYNIKQLVLFLKRIFEIISIIDARY